MKYSSVVKIEPLIVNKKDAGAIVGNDMLFDQMERDSWIKPIRTTKASKLFLVEDIKACVARLKLGQFPQVSVSSAC